MHEYAGDVLYALKLKP